MTQWQPPPPPRLTLSPITRSPDILATLAILNSAFHVILICQLDDTQDRSH